MFFYRKPIEIGNTTEILPPVHNVAYYLSCMMGGMISCSITHSLMTPVDLVKCEMQANPTKYNSLVDGLQKIKERYGWTPQGGLFLGLVPTFVGYAFEGSMKFGLYEVFKDFYKWVFGTSWKVLLYLIASCTAEFFADIFLCPFEVIKVRMQTQSSDEGFPFTLQGAFKLIQKVEGYKGFYTGIIPLWCRQIPYTMVKFTVFERIIEMFYDYIFTAPKSSYSPAFQLTISFVGGFLAGIMCAIISHPADTVMTKLNHNKGTTFAAIMKEIGCVGLWRGIGPRIVLIGTLTAFQWYIYDLCKTAMGLGTTGH